MHKRYQFMVLGDAHMKLVMSWLIIAVQSTGWMLHYRSSICSPINSHTYQLQVFGLIISKGHTHRKQKLQQAPLDSNEMYVLCECP